MNTILTLHDPQIARDYYLAGVWRRETMYDLLRDHARRRPDALALRDSQNRLSWAQLLVWVDAVAESMHRAGLRQGSRVSFWLPNRVEGVVVFLACSRNGYVCNPSLHQNYTVAEIAQLLERIQCEAFFGQPGYGADADRHDVFAAIAELKHVRQIWRVARRGEADVPLPGEAPFPVAEKTMTSSPVSDNPDKVVYLAFTSGTTGTPKGVMHSDNSLLANGRALVRDWNHDERTVILSLSPLSHHIATVALEQSLVAGCELVLNDAPAGQRALDWILETGATYVMGVPTHAMDILAEMRRRGLRKMGAVTVFYMAGASIPREIAQSFLEFGVTPQNIYGMTENGSHQYTLPGDDQDTIVSTCGRACMGYEVKLWRQDNPDEEVPPGEIGEIGGRGGNLMLGYFGNQQATEASFNAHGWFMSGDLGVLDPKGCLRIVGRKKDLIIRGGHNIHPARIEDLVLRHPAVFKAAAFPVADERLGEKVCLAVIFHAAQQCTGEQILRHLYEEGLSKYDMPEYFVALAHFPMTASGKILKRELIEWARTGQIDPQPVRWLT